MPSTIATTATVAWSPREDWIVTGTATGALDASFSTSSHIDIYNYHQPLTPIHTVEAPARFARLAWSSSFGKDGLIAGGLDNGNMMLWDATDLTPLFTSTEHTGAVHGLAFSHSQQHLLASGAANGDVKIWDCSNPKAPQAHAPANARSQRLDHIRHLDWNHQVPHILATASNSGWCVVWDLRNKREVMQLGNLARGTGVAGPMSAVQWHPGVATQLYTASEDDSAPAVLCWDLRNAHAPERTLSNGHTKGILSMAWSTHDTGLLLTSGKDHRTLLWDVAAATPTFTESATPRTHWVFDVQFAKHDPTLFTGAGFDGRVEVSRLRFGGWAYVDPMEVGGAASSNVVRNEDPFGLSSGHVDTDVVTSGGDDMGILVKTPPKWMQVPCVARFGFGGRLFSFSNHVSAASAMPAQQPGGMQQVAHPARKVVVRTVVTEPEFVRMASEFYEATKVTSSGDASDTWKGLCGAKAEGTSNEEERLTWKVLGVLFEADARDRLVKMMGVEREQLAQELSASMEDDTGVETVAVNGDESAGQVDGADFFTSTSPVNSSSADVSGPFKIQTTTGDDSVSKLDHIITQAVLLGDFESAVKAALAADRLADALVLAMCGGRRLLARTRATFFTRRLANSDSIPPYLRLLRDVSGNDLESIVRDADLADWRHVLVVLCTYAKGEDFGGLCRKLGERLESVGTGDASSRRDAVVCYLAAGDVKHAVSIWNQILEETSTAQLEAAMAEEDASPTENSLRYASLHHFIEKISVLRAAIEFTDSALETSVEKNAEDGYELTALYERYGQYAAALASQGQLVLAASYLSLTPVGFGLDTNAGRDVAELKHCIAAVGMMLGSGRKDEQPQFPWTRQFVGRQGEVDPKRKGSTFKQDRATTSGYGAASVHPTQPTYPPQGAYAGYSNDPYASSNFVSSYAQPGVPAMATAYGGYGGGMDAGHYGGSPAAANVYAGAYTQPASYQPVAPPVASPPKPMIPQPNAINSFATYNATPGYAQPRTDSHTGPVELPPSKRTDIPGWNDVPDDLVKPKKSLAPAAVPPPPAGNAYSVPSQYAASPMHGQPPVPPPHGGFTHGAPAHQPQPMQPSYGAPPPGHYATPNIPVASNPYAPTVPMATPVDPTSGGPSGQFAPQAGYPRVVTQTPAKVERAPAPPAKKRHPAGDRSHIPPDQLHILTTFDREFARLQSILPPQQKRFLDDMQKRLVALGDALNHEEVAANVIALLLRIVRALDAQDLNSAHAETMDMFSKVGGAGWSVGVKRLVETVISTSQRR